MRSTASTMSGCSKRQRACIVCLPRANTQTWHVRSARVVDASRDVEFERTRSRTQEQRTRPPPVTAYSLFMESHSTICRLSRLRFDSGRAASKAASYMWDMFKTCKY